MKIVIVGGVAAGMSAASKAKRTDPSVEIVVFEKGPVLSYGACGLPYYVSGENDDHKRMVMRTQADFEKSGIVTKLFHEVLKVNTDEKHVMVKDLQTGNIFIENYDKLMISSGASPIVPPLEGVNLMNVMKLKTLDDGIDMRKVVERPEIREIVIVGAGYIGIELAEAMVTMGKSVRVIEMNQRILKSFDKELSDIAEVELMNHGVKLNLGEGVKRLIGTDVVTGIETSNGIYPADLVVLSIGVKPNTSFLKNTKIKLNERGVVVIDREMQTSVKDVYSAGDCAEVYHLIKQENDYIPLGTTANKCGRIAGGNMLGDKQKYVGTLGSAAIKICDIEMGRTGLSEEEALEQKIDFGSKMITTYNHPPYYPNQQSVSIKLVYEKGSYKLLGAQAVGGEGTVLRVDCLAMAIHSGLTTKAIGMVDLIYAPPFAGVWDAIHIAANAIK